MDTESATIETEDSAVTSEAEVVYSPDVAISESQSDKLINRFDRFLAIFERGSSQEIAAVKDKKFNWGILTALISFTVLIGGATWFFHSEFSKIEDKLSKIDKGMAKFEIAIKILSDAQDGKTKELVHDALAVAKFKSESGDTESARKAIETANELIAQEKAAKIPAAHEFFQDSISKYNAFWSSSRGKGPIADEAFKGTLQLAEYRSSITTPPPNFHPEHTYTTGNFNSAFIGNLSIVDGHLFLSDSRFSGPQSFTLDNYILKNVVFDGVKIIYNGGPIVFQNVRFVNCTFEVHISLAAKDFLEVAALGQASAKLG